MNWFDILYTKGIHNQDCMIYLLGLQYFRGQVSFNDKGTGATKIQSYPKLYSQLYGIGPEPGQHDSPTVAKLLMKTLHSLRNTTSRQNQSPKCATTHQKYSMLIGRGLGHVVPLLRFCALGSEIEFSQAFSGQAELSCCSGSGQIQEYFHFS